MFRHYFLYSLAPQACLKPSIVLLSVIAQTMRIRLAFQVVQFNIRAVPVFIARFDKPKTQVRVLVISLDVYAL